MQLQLRRLGLGNPSNRKDTFESIVENVMRIWKVYKVSWRIKWDRVARAVAHFEVAWLTEIESRKTDLPRYVIEVAGTSCNGIADSLRIKLVYRLQRRRTTNKG